MLRGTWDLNSSETSCVDSPVHGPEAGFAKVNEQLPSQALGNGSSYCGPPVSHSGTLLLPACDCQHIPIRGRLRAPNVHEGGGPCVDGRPVVTRRALWVMEGPTTAPEAVGVAFDIRTPRTIKWLFRVDTFDVEVDQ